MRCIDRFSRLRAAMTTVRRERGYRFKGRQNGTSLNSSVRKSAYWASNVVNILISLARTSSSIDNDTKIDSTTWIYGFSISSSIYSS